MLKPRARIGMALGFAFLVLFALGGRRSVAAETAPEPVLYPHIAEAPIFGSLFAQAAQETTVDESALRYYASLHNVARAEAEIRRLKQLYPRWTPPTNIYASAGAGANEQPLWDLLGQGRFDELRAAIARRTAQEPDWRPSRDLTMKIARKESLVALAKASDAQAWAQVLEIADAEPTALHCAYIDAVWRVSDAFLNLNMAPRAYALYRAAIANCTDRDERLATVRKAVSRFSVDEVKALIAMGAKSDDGVREFDPARIDLTRARIAAVNAGKTQDDIESDELQRYFKEIAATRDVSDLVLAGWWEYGHAHYARAIDWFRLAPLGPPPGKSLDEVKIAEGLVLSLAKAARWSEALEIAADWREASPTLKRSYVGAMVALLGQSEPAAVIPPARLGAFVAFVAQTHELDGQIALAWRALADRNFEEAAQGFATALGWRQVDARRAPDAKGVDPQIAKAVEGYATALANLERRPEAMDIADAWRGAGPGNRALFLSLMLTALGDDLHAQVVPADLIAHFADIAEADKSATAEAALAWLRYRNGEMPAAIEAFGKAIAWSPVGKGDPRLHLGLALALQSAGRLPEAEEAAWSAHGESADLGASYIAIVIAEFARPDALRSLTTSRIERFAAFVRAQHSSAGAEALGWLRMRSENCGYAAPWFRAALAWRADHANDVKTLEGLALSLSAVGLREAAENVAYEARDRSSRLRGLFIGLAVEALDPRVPAPAVSEARLQRLATVALKDHSPVGARALAWRRYRDAGCGYGAQWFRLASLWSADDKRDVKTDEGHGLALRAIGRLAEAETLARRWADKNADMRKLYVDVMVEALSRDNPPEPLDEARLTDFVAAILPMKSALGAQALGWYRLERGEYAEARKWFKNAIDWWPPQRDDEARKLSAPVDDYKPILAKLALTPEAYRRTPRAYPASSALIGKSRENYVETPEGAAKTWEGYALTLRGSGHVEEAERIAYDWRERWPALRRLFLDIAASEIARADGAPPSPERLARYVAAIEEDRFVDGAAALAWRDYNHKSLASATEWFGRAIDWSAEAGSGEPDFRLVQGLTLTLRGQKKFDEAINATLRWRKVSARFNLLYLETTLVALRESGRRDKVSEQTYAELEAAMNEARSFDGALSIGWIAFEAQDYARALLWFKNAIDWKDESSDAAKALEGYALTLDRLGRFAELAEFARRWRDESAAVRSAYYSAMIALLTKSNPTADVSSDARADFEALVETDRNPVGAQALGWSRALRGDWAPGQRWFESALEWRGLDAIASAREIAVDPANIKLIEGYVQSLRGAGRLDRAEDVAFAWRERAQSIDGLYIQVATQELSTATGPLPADRVARFAAVADAERSTIGASNLGWFSYRLADAGSALSWFAKARAWSADGEGDAKTNEGFALALRGVGRLVEAEDFAYDRRDQSRELRAAYVAAVSDQLARPELANKITPVRLERFAALVRVDKFVSGAQALGWRRLQDGNCGYAAPWFRAAIAWSKDPDREDKANSGLAQSLRAVGMYRAAEEVSYAWRERSRDLRALYVKIVVEELTREWPHVPVDEPRIARFAAIVLKDHSSEGAQALAWRRYGEAGCGYGGQWFRLASLWSEDGVGDAKLNEGYALTQRAIGRLARAEEIVWPWIERRPEMKKLYIDIVVEELSRDNPPQPMPDERLSRFVSTIAPLRSALGAQALGWYHFARGEIDPAEQAFAEALDWWPHPKDDSSQKLSVPVEDYKPVLGKLALTQEDYRRTPRAYPNSSLLIGKATENYVDTPLGLAKTVEGYVLASGALGRWAEAEKLAWEWRDRFPRLRELFIDTVVEELYASKGAPVADDLLQRFVTLVEADHAQRGAEALAWRAAGAADHPAAARWFKLALDWRRPEADLSAQIALLHGYVDALRATGQPDEALAAIQPWRDRWPEAQTLTVELEVEALQKLDPTSAEAARRVMSLANEVTRAKSASGAASLGWLAYQRKEYPAAQAWFKQAVLWTPKDGTPDAKALEGYARTLQAQGRVSDSLTFAAEWAARAPSLEPIYVEAATDALASASASGDPVPTDALVRAGSAFAKVRSVDGARALAWQRVSAKDWVAALAWFQAARNWEGANADDVKTDEGTVLALRNLQRDDEAEALAFAGAPNSDAMRELYIEIVADRLTRKPPAPPDEAGMKRFAEFVTAAKSALGAQALGWYSYSGRQLPAAVAWFEASLQWEPGEDAALGLALAYRQGGDRAGFARVVATYGARYARVAELVPGHAAHLQERRAVLESVTPPQGRPVPPPDAPTPRTVEAAPVPAEAAADRRTRRRLRRLHAPLTAGSSYRAPACPVWR